MVLVAGATGYLGRHVVKALSDSGYRVRALVRRREGLGELGDLTDSVVVADARNPQEVRGACEAVDTVITTIGLMGRSGSLTPRDVDLGANLVLLREAERAGVRRFIYVSVLQRPGMERLAIVQAKSAFEAELASSAISTTVIRPNGFFSDMRAFLDMARAGRVYVFGRGRYRINPIHGADLAATTAGLVAGGEPVLEVGGPEVLTHEEIAKKAFAALGASPRITHVPSWVARVLVAVVRLLPASRRAAPEFVLTVLSRDLVAPRTGQVTLDAFYRAEAAEGRPARPRRK